MAKKTMAITLLSVILYASTETNYIFSESQRDWFCSLNIVERFCLSAKHFKGGVDELSAAMHGYVIVGKNQPGGFVSGLSVLKNSGEPVKNDVNDDSIIETYFKGFCSHITSIGCVL
ncbi:hypothetical protein [Kosakonia sacchari]|uniref:hypothetical protein n=1 Tax=Kosakonia sacchari TaxID=1158459 RepID=UPI001584C17A|nr:hypothetical protein [Kosakonia sacchari]NUL35039.1 hypothetical protein [Kosakonia sacchari]